MKLNRKFIAIIACCLVFGSGVVRSSAKRVQFTQVRVVSLPADTVLDEYSIPVITSGGEVGYIPSVVGGALISFHTASAKVLSSVSFGEAAGTISMVETGKRRLIALPTSNDPAQGRPATVSIINATVVDKPERLSLVVLPPSAQITPNTRALLTPDGRFGVVASSSSEPAMFSFNVETGQVISRLQLQGWPSEVAIYDGVRSSRDYMVAAVSAATNLLTIIKLDGQGRLSAVASFGPSNGRFDLSNNPSFSSDGAVIYVAAAGGDQLFAVDSQKGTLIKSIRLAPSPHRITVGADPNGGDLIAVTHIRPLAVGKSSGVTVIANNKGQLAVRAEFTPPGGIRLSPANNVIFDRDASVAFIGSMNGVLFAFNTKTGEVEDHKVIGNELRALVINKATRTILAVRSSPTSDDIVVVAFDLAGEAPTASKLAPEITRVSGNATHLRLIIEGTKLSKGVIVEFAKEGKILFQQSPVAIADNQLAVIVPVKNIEGPGKFELRVVTADNVASDPVVIDPSALLSKVYVHSVPVKAAPAPPLKPATTPALKPATVLRSVHPEVSGRLLRVFVETDGVAEFRDFTLTNPSRIVLDIEDVRNLFGNKTLPLKASMARRIRIGRPVPNVVRVVVDCKNRVPYQVMRDGSRLVIAVGQGNL